MSDRPPHPRILVTGKMSVGKSTLINALYGHPNLLPVATRDCTQTNTLIRPATDAGTDGTLTIRYLTKQRAHQYATGSVHWHRISEYVTRSMGPFGPRLDEMPPGDALRAGVRSVRDAFKNNPGEAVVHDNLPDALTAIDDLLNMTSRICDATPVTIDKPFASRSEFLMGRRGADGRVVGEGELMAQEWVELCVRPVGWEDAPQLLDTPWIPTIHDTRRADLISRAAEDSDAIMVVMLPEPFVIEDWLADFLNTFPDQAQNVIVVMNQADTIDDTRFFGRDGFVEAFESTREIMRKNGMDPTRIVVTVPWLACLKRMPPVKDIPDRIARIETVMTRLRKKTAPGRVPDALIDALSPACDPDDCGIETLKSVLSAIQPRSVNRPSDQR